MRIFTKNACIFLWTFSFIILSGCHPDLKPYMGAYSGKILFESSEQSEEGDVAVRVFSEEFNKLSLMGHILGQPVTRDWNWEIRTYRHQSSIELTAHGEVNYVGRLNRISNECYASADLPSGGTLESTNTRPYARICLGKTESQLEVRGEASSISLTLHRSQPGEFPYLEIPADYTTAELRDWAGAFSFDFRYSSEAMMRAQLKLRLSKLNLVPHISATSLLNIGAYSLRGVLTSVGELVPFLFPSHWLLLRENARLLKVQEYAVNLLKLDSMQIAESFGLALGRDQQIWKQLKEDRKLHSEVEAEIQTLEEQGKLQLGSLMAIQSAGNNLDQAIANLESVIPLAATALSHAVGFVNPNAIGNLRVDIQDDIKSPPEIDLNDLELRAVQVSPEIKQLEELIEASRTAKRNRLFQWMSPSGDPEGSLGLGLPTYISIGSSHIRDLLISKDKISSLLLRNVSDAFNDYYKSLDSYQFAEKGVVLQNSRIQEARNALRNGSIDSVHDLRDSLQLLAINHANVLNAEYSWYISLTRINRLLVKGPYGAQF